MKKKVSLLYHTFNGTLNHVSILPKKLDSECEFCLSLTENDTVTEVTIRFTEVVALEFSMNFSDCPADDANLGGFFKIPGKKQKRKLLERNLKRRHKEWMMTRFSGTILEPEEPELPAEEVDLLAQMEETCGRHQLYLLQSRGGSWLVLAKAYDCVEKTAEQ